jgi:hypothetical protein
MLTVCRYPYRSVWTQQVTYSAEIALSQINVNLGFPCLSAHDFRLFLSFDGLFWASESANLATYATVSVKNQFVIFYVQNPF